MKAGLGEGYRFTHLFTAPRMVSEDLLLTRHCVLFHLWFIKKKKPYKVGTFYRCANRGSITCLTKVTQLVSGKHGIPTRGSLCLVSDIVTATCTALCRLLDIINYKLLHETTAILLKISLL